jgi:uncharacterized membrane protein
MKQTMTKNMTPRDRVSTAAMTYRLTMTALFIALTYVATAFINIKIPFLASQGGLIHLGNIPLFVAAALYGKKTGAMAGAFGMGLFDLTSGWVSWAPFTFVICGLIGFVFGVIVGKKGGKIRLILAVFAAAFIKVAGYYIAEIILCGNFFTPVTSVPGNLVQIFVAGIVAVPLIEILKRYHHAAGLKMGNE